MKITNEKIDGLHREYAMTVPAADIDAALQSELQRIGQKAKIPGFRPGKIPMNVLRQRYGKEVMDEVLWNSMNAAMRSLIEKQSLRPAMKPDANITSYTEGGDLQFTLSLYTMPDVPALDYDKITIAEYEFEVPESEIDEGIERLAMRQRHFHEAKAGTKAKNGDMVKMDFLGKLDGVPFEGGKGENFQLELGSGQFIPGFEEQLIGSKAGDTVEVKVTFPSEYHAPNLAGKDATFDVTVHSVHHAHDAHIDDAFANEVGFESLEKLREAVRQQLAADYQQMARSRAKKELFDWLDTNVKFDIPAKMQEMEFAGVWQQLQKAKAEGDPSLNKPDAELREEYQIISERRVRLGILLAEIGRMNNVQVTRDELSQAVMAQARQFPGQERKVFDFYQKHPEHVDELRGPIIEDKAVDFILSKVKREKKPISLEALIGGDDAEAAPKPKKAAAKKAPAKKAEGADEAEKPAKPAAKKPAAKAKKD